MLKEDRDALRTLLSSDATFQKQETQGSTWFRRNQTFTRECQSAAMPPSGSGYSVPLGSSDYLRGGVEGPQWPIRSKGPHDTPPSGSWVPDAKAIFRVGGCPLVVWGA
jgi:hypothetical protein